MIILNNVEIKWTFIIFLFFIINGFQVFFMYNIFEKVKAVVIYNNILKKLFTVLCSAIVDKFRRYCFIT